MKEIVKFHKVDKKPDCEKIREDYKKDFKEYVKKREQKNGIIYIDTRQRM